MRLNRGVILRSGITLVVLIYLGLKLDWLELSKQLSQSEPMLLLIASLLCGSTLLLASFRWWLLLRIQNIVLPLKTVSALTFIGQFFNLFLFGATGGDIVKILYLIKYVPKQKTHSALSVIMDRAIGLFILLCIVLSVLPSQLQVVARSEEITVVARLLSFLFIFIIGISITIVIFPFRRVPLIFHRIWQVVPMRNRIELLIDGIRQHGRWPGLTLAAMASSLAIWFLVFAAGYCIALAIHLDVTFLQVLVILSIVIFSINLPISVGGHGVREGMFIIMFALYGTIVIDQQTGVGGEPAVLYSVLFFALFAVWGLVGGVIYLTFKHQHGKLS